MSKELDEAMAIIGELVGLDSFRVIPLVSKNPKVRLYGAQATRPITIGTHPVVIADNKGVRLLDHKKWQAAWDYDYKHLERAHHEA